MKGFYLWILLMLNIVASQAQGTWTQKAYYGGTGRNKAVGFSIAGKGYIGTGWTNTTSQDFWEYNPATDVWTQMASFAGTARIDAVGFAMGSRGYIGTGQAITSAYLKDWWEYNPTANTWVQKADFPGSARSQAVGFCIGIKGYLGTGNTGSAFVADFYEYDRLTDTWTQKADFGGGVRSNAIGFSIGVFTGAKGYIGTGTDMNLIRKDFWEYNPVTDSWKVRAHVPFMGRYYASGFSIGTKGYIGCGILDSLLGDSQDFYEYDTTANAWTQMADYGGGYKCQATAFSTGGKGYLGTGNGVSIDFWEFSPDTITGIKDPIQGNSSSTVYPNPVSSTATLKISTMVKGSQFVLYDAFGKEIMNLPLNCTSLLISRDNLAGGIYFYSIKSENKSISTGKIIITDPN